MNFITCGYILVNDEYTEVIYDPDLSVCFFRDPWMGDLRLIDGLQIGYPSPTPDVLTAEPGILGIVFAEEGEYRILDESTIEFTPDDADEDEAIISINLDCDYDGDYYDDF